MKTAVIFGALLVFLYSGFRPPEGISKVPLADISFEKRSHDRGATFSVPNENEHEESSKGK